MTPTSAPSQRPNASFLRASTTLRIIALVVALAHATSGCSWITLRGYNDAAPGAYAEDILCPTEKGALVLDGIGAAGTLSVGIATLATSGGTATLDNFGKVTVGLAFTLSAMFIASLVTGSVWWKRCTTRKRNAPRTPLGPDERAKEPRSTSSPGS